MSGHARRKSLHQLQDELVQANKLAVLGRISAGVAHEIRSAALGDFAVTSTAPRAFLARADVRKANSNLDSIASLTDRIAAITQELRTFSRKTSATPQPVPLEAAIAGALLLMVSAVACSTHQTFRAPRPSARQFK